MFTGIVEAQGSIQWLKMSAKGTELRLTVPPPIAASLAPGDSLAVNGCCLTVTSRRKETLVFDVLEETLRATSLGAQRAGAAVNLERPLAANARLGGHFVQGHVDVCAEVVSRESRGEDTRIEVALPGEFRGLVVYKGSVAINGVSLTVAECLAASFAVWIIPHTREVTNLGALGPGSPVNIEFDILAKYVERMLGARLPAGA